MALTKIKLGELIEQVLEVNSDLKFGFNDVMGMTLTKEIIPTKADINYKELPKFILVSQNDFIYNPRTHGKKIGFGYNNENKKFLISWNNIAFRVKKNKIDFLLPDYLWMWLKRDEWDRFAAFNSWGSSTEVFSWSALCDMKMDLPPIEIQRKYVEIYNGMVDNQSAYETGLEDLKIVCNSYIERLMKKYPLERLEHYIIRTNIKNTGNKIKNVKNVSVYKSFNEPTAKVNKNELSGYKIVKPNEISFVKTTHNEKVFAFAINNTEDDIVVTSVNEVFKTTDKLDPYYLSLFFMRKEFDRYARFHSWGSARETFVWEDLCDVKIPVPPMNIQKSIADIFKAFQERKKINEQLKQQIKNICPVLIKGAVEEAKRS